MSDAVAVAGRQTGRVWALHGLVLAALAVAPLIAGPYTQGNLARILVLAVYATGYNLAFGYTGLLSLGHALFFAAGMYALGMGTAALGLGAGAGILAGALAGGLAAALIGMLALRTTGVSFMIVTMMFAQAGYLTILYFTPWTRGDEGIVLAQATRTLGPLDLSQDGPRYAVAFALYAAALLASLVLARSRFGRVLVAVRENPERTRMLGYDPVRLRLAALVLSGFFAGASGAAYAALFGYVGASFAAIPYSILPLLWVLLGGAGTTLGPFLGVALMFYLIDWASGVTTAYLFLVGLALVILVTFAPKGILGTIRERAAPWLP
ncbi:MAG: branched-chain amino acid ABC transporter permease [Pseudomonadota bacterium]